jgi:hypothetical protein
LEQVVHPSFSVLRGAIYSNLEKITNFENYNYANEHFLQHRHLAVPARDLDCVFFQQESQAFLAGEKRSLEEDRRNFFKRQRGCGLVSLFFSRGV